MAAALGGILRGTTSAAVQAAVSTAVAWIKTSTGDATGFTTQWMPGSAAQNELPLPLFDNAGAAAAAFLRPVGDPRILWLGFTTSWLSRNS